METLPPGQAKAPIVERKILCMNTTLAAIVRAARISVKQQATSYRQKSQASSSC